jgi:MoaA/NifB/PqqE/SkfB family radical SAM enzyme
MMSLILHEEFSLLAYIAPTYRCNLKCENCYSAKYAQEFSGDLGWCTFIDICKFLYTRYTSFCFIGGEPTQWKFINEAILVLRNKHKRVSVFTNGISALRVSPSSVMINTNQLFDGTEQSSVLRNINNYRSNSKVVLRFNVGNDFRNDNIAYAVSLARKYADSVSISFLFPDKPSLFIGDTIFKLASQMSSHDVKVRIARATPLCIFDDKQMEFLIQRCRLKGQCGLPSSSVFIHPDGKTIQPCPELNIRATLNDLGSSKTLFYKDIEQRKQHRTPFCLNCKYFKCGQCCGGCLAYSLL